MKNDLLRKLRIAQKCIDSVADYLELRDQDTDSSLDQTFSDVLYELNNAYISLEDCGKDLENLLEFICEEEPASKQEIFYTPAVVVSGELAHLQFEVAKRYAEYHKTFVRNEKGYILADYR